MSTRVSVYVDGFNLYHGPARRDRTAGPVARPGVDDSVDAAARAKSSSCHYFTALVQGAGPLERQQRYLAALEAHGDCTTMHVGRFQHKPARCRACGHSWSSYEEKESDVALAVQAVADVAQGLTDQAWFLSGDSDMVPSVRTIQRMTPEARTVAVFPPRRSSIELERAVDGKIAIFDKTPRKHQLPKTVWNEGRAENLARPAHWH